MILALTSLLTATMDIISSCLALTPVPYLGIVFSVFQFIYASIEQVQTSKEQLVALAQSAAQLLHTIDSQCRAGRLSQATTAKPLENLVK